jgi:hypothetical protein
VTSTLGITHPRPVDLLPPTLQTIPEAVTANIAIARARTRSRIMAGDLIAMDAPRDHSVNTRHNDPITPSARHGVSDP